MNQSKVVELTVATPMRRLLAFIVDILILMVIGFPIVAAFGDAADLTNPDKVNTTFLVISMIVPASYHIFFLCTMSGTLGKLALGLYVSDRQGNRIRPDTAILRYLIYMLGQLVFVGGVISAVLVLTDRRGRRALHDRVAGTLVVVGRPPGVEL